jgi:cysteine desulfurase/selenocysteine lyase
MNTTTRELPSSEFLEKIANEIFSALPGKELRYDQVFSEKNNLTESGKSDSYLPDSVYAEIPKSLAGKGISPSAENVTTFNINNPPTSLPDPHFAENGVPKSLSGSDLSPSAHHLNQDHFSYLNQGNYLNKEYPFQQTSLKHFHSDLFPTDFNYTNEKELKKLVDKIYVPNSSFQIPFQHDSYLKKPVYYYEKQPTHFDSYNDPFKIIHGFDKSKFDINAVKRDFPILGETVNGKSLVWLDNAATTQKPRQVIERIRYFYEHENSNIHRAAHKLAERATDAYEEARKKVQQFINAASVNEIVFVRGATEAINLVAQSWGEQNLNNGDEIIISYLEHHANIVPWQQLASKKGLKLKVIPVDDDGQVLMDEYAKLLTHKTKLVSFTQVSNALGSITPAKAIIEMAHVAGAKVLVDGAQSVSHMRTDVTYLNADWFVFSGHKVFAPTGIGVLYGKEELLNKTQPWQGGGNMIVDVTFEHTRYHNAPARFEAGTGNIADAVGLGAAIDYVSKIGIDLIGQYEHYLLVYATGLLKEIPGLRLIGTAAEKASVVSFVLKGYQTEEVGTALNAEGIAVRSGHHCAQPILRRFGLESTVRPSLAFYNTCEDIDRLVAALYHLSDIKNKIK